MFFRWVLFCLYVVKTNWVVKVKGLKGIYIYPILLWVFIDAFECFWPGISGASRDQRSFRWVLLAGGCLLHKTSACKVRVFLTLKGIDV